MDSGCLYEHLYVLIVQHNLYPPSLPSIIFMDIYFLIVILPVGLNWSHYAEYGVLNLQTRMCDIPDLIKSGRLGSLSKHRES